MMDILSEECRSHQTCRACAPTREHTTLHSRARGIPGPSAVTVPAVGCQLTHQMGWKSEINHRSSDFTRLTRTVLATFDGCGLSDVVVV